ncbi:MAG: ATP-binding protein [Verrucomicrobiia bacterium]
MANLKADRLHFDVSSGLKTVLGSELITDDEVAIFELVKNSFDAEASHVDLYFDARQIVISDNGYGMTMDDINKKWLQVGYSTKREQNRHVSFRDSAERIGRFAGSKGVGRLSSDRLGRWLTLQTRAKGETSGPVHRVKVDWSLFDKDHLKRFEVIPLEHSEQTTGFELPRELRKNRHGTVITIEEPRQEWGRNSLRRLKSALAKLINPFGPAADGFTIRIAAPAENGSDKEAARRAKSKGEEPLPTDIVNGDVGNFIFSTLCDKTTFIKVRVSNSGDYIESSLIDRGELIYKIREPNEFKRLAKSGFRCEMYFLNASAKHTFARRMGVPSVQFGSVFLFRNGFRVFPIGEWNDDWFGMERRKGQGYARFLGARDVIGRIDVEGSEKDFAEASSRNTGLIETPAVVELRKCFMEHCLKRLEKYVVPVTFPDKEDKFAGDVSRLQTDPGRARVVSAVAKLVDDKHVELLDYSHRLIRILSERSEHFESSISNIRAIAERTKDKELFRKTEVAQKRFEELRKREEMARRQADEERKAKEAAQARAAKAEADAEKTAEQLEEERKRNLFLSSIASLDTSTILNLHHQVTIYAVDIHQQIENLIVSLAGKKTVATEDVLAALEGIALLNSKVLGVAKFATKANFRMESEKIKADLGSYLQQYITGVVRDHLTSPLRRVTVSSDGKDFVQEFKPIDVTVVVDNLISNSKKANATQVHFEITHPHPDSIYITVTDNGVGFHRRITEISRVFEKGFTTTDGAGLGLFHIKQVLGEMNGTIEAMPGNPKGAVFQIKIAQ